jgi:hypothetical protein
MRSTTVPPLRNRIAGASCSIKPLDDLFCELL